MAYSDSQTQIFSKQLLEILPVVYQKKAFFVSAFSQLQAIDGVRERDIAFTVKTNDMPVVIGTYSTDANVAFGTGTANSSRFGEMKEVIYEDTDVPYDAPFAFHEGLDRYTVNADLSSAVTKRLVLQAQALLVRWNKKDGAALVANGTDLGVDDSDVFKLFNAAADQYTQLEIIPDVKAYITSDLYNSIIDNANVSSYKGSSVNIDENGLAWFKGFQLIKVPDVYMGGKSVIFAPDGIGLTFVGISTTRTMEADDFDGVHLQGAGKDGVYIPEANKPAIFFASKS